MTEKFLINVGIFPTFLIFTSATHTGRRKGQTMGLSSYIQPSMTLGRFKGFNRKSFSEISFTYIEILLTQIKLSSFLYLLKSSPTCIHFEVTEPNLRLGGSGPTVRILGMIDRLEPKVNLSSFLHQEQSFNP